MHPDKSPYSRFSLCQDMWDSIRVFRAFNPACVAPFEEAIRSGSVQGVFLTGEGSSRIFPAKRAIYEALKRGLGVPSGQGSVKGQRPGYSQGQSVEGVPGEGGTPSEFMETGKEGSRESMGKEDSRESSEKEGSPRLQGGSGETGSREQLEVAVGKGPVGRGASLQFLPIFTEGATQALEYNLKDYAVFGASNSGRTKEVVRLFQVLRQNGHPHLYGVTAHAGSPLQELSVKAYVLQSGKEGAVAATKSVMEQALFFQALFSALKDSARVGLGEKFPEGSSAGNLPGAGTSTLVSPSTFLPRQDLSEAVGKLEQVLSMELDPPLVDRLARAETLYFSGRNNGVAEELTLKTNEITRKKSDFLEGTYAVHGIEEVMNPEDAVVLVDPFPQEEEKFKEVLENGVGCYVCALSTHPTSFPTILIPEGGMFQNYIELAAGWNLLVELGLRLGIDLDKPVRARKVGNEVMGT